MKKLVLLGAVAVAGLSSCKKDYNCSYELTLLGSTSTVEVECNKCSKSDIEELESVGYDCTKK